MQIPACDLQDFLDCVCTRLRAESPGKVCVCVCVYDYRCMSSAIEVSRMSCALWLTSSAIESAVCGSRNASLIAAERTGYCWGRCGL